MIEGGMGKERGNVTAELSGSVLCVSRLVQWFLRLHLGSILFSRGHTQYIAR